MWQLTTPPGGHVQSGVLCLPVGSSDGGDEEGGGEGEGGFMGLKAVCWAPAALWLGSSALL